MSAYNLGINPRLAAYIKTRDKRVAKIKHWDESSMTEAFSKLVKTGCVTMGGRASCGGKPDPTWIEFMNWSEVVSMARKYGYVITETSIKQPNAWATKSGGFWGESEYRTAPLNPVEINHERI